MRDVRAEPEQSRVNRSSDVPLHVQVADTLRQGIVSGAHQCGERLDSEKRLAFRLGLSVVTVRSGLALLERDGWVVKRHGLGTFVRNPFEHDLSQLRTTSEVVRAEGGEATVRLLAFGAVMPPPAVAKAMGLPARRKMIRVERLHADAESSIAVVRSFLPLEVRKHAELLIADSSATTVDLWEKRLGIAISGGRHRIQAAPAPDDIAEALTVAPGSPILLLERVSYAEDGRALEFIASYYNWQRYSFSVVLPRNSMPVTT